MTIRVKITNMDSARSVDVWTIERNKRGEFPSECVRVAGGETIHLERDLKIVEKPS